MKDRRVLQFKINRIVGIDRVFAALYSEKRMAKRIAIKSMMEGCPFADCVPSESMTLLLVFPGNTTYSILDEQGNVEEYHGDVINIGL